MSNIQEQVQAEPVAGWIGGFEESNSDFSYPNPNLSSLPMLDNMDNINLLQRQQGVKWPEFSWETILGKKDSRCFQMFSPYISRLGYTDEGRVYSIICPQQGACSPKLGCMNVEITVTGQRGWVNETTKLLACDMMVTGKIWFSPSALSEPWVQKLWAIFQKVDHPFPHKKAYAIEVPTHKMGNPNQPIFPVRAGENQRFKSPDFARHEQEAFDVGNIDVEIGKVTKTNDLLVDDFNELVLYAFNKHSGNMLKEGNVLSWNVWFAAPTYVDTVEWREHAEKWRESIDADHGSPTGPGTNPRYFNGTPFQAQEGLLGAAKDEEQMKIDAFLAKYGEEK